MSYTPPVFHPIEFQLDMCVVANAMRFVETAHAGQTRWDGTPYYQHLLRVANRVMAHGFLTTDAVLAALLHDVVEDTPVTLSVVHDMFGSHTATRVDWLTQRPLESRDDYFTRCMKGDPVTLAVKFADRCDNVAGLHTCPDLPEHRGHIFRYCEELRDYFFPHISQVPETLANELIALTERARLYFEDADGPNALRGFGNWQDRPAPERGEIRVYGVVTPPLPADSPLYQTLTTV